MTPSVQPWLNCHPTGNQTSLVLLALALLPLLSCSAVRNHHGLLQQRAELWGFVEGESQLGDHRVHHWTGGEGRTVILVHGFGGDGLVTWWPQARRLARSHRVIIPDLLWFGGSDSAAKPGLDAQAQALAALVDHLVPADETVDVVGISYGGFVALRYGALRPERQHRLVMMDSPGPLFSAEDHAGLLERFAVDSVEDLFVPGEAEAIQRLLDLAYHRPPPLPRSLLEDMRRTIFSAHQDEQRALLADLQSDRDRYSEITPAVYQASLVIWGRHDRVFPLALGRALAQLLGAELAIVEESAHAPNVERPRATSDLLESFLSTDS
ncbi:MAG: alpha/beta hydrolase [Myxococcota bacterium]|nr:alpha/beta hydrolase [Myxococcota bacterium]